MIDIHTHLLYGVDDGSRDAIETLTCLKMAEEAGFTDIILTPHYVENNFENSFAIIKPKIEELKTKIEDNNLNIKVHQGNEVYFSENLGEMIANNEVSRLAGSRYFLFELPMHSKLITLSNVIMQIKEAGAIPVLAHPERYEFIQENPNVAMDLIAQGVLLQCNYGSIFGQYGKNAQKTIIKMLRSNMVHFLGTDTHRTGYVYAHFYKVKKEFLRFITEEEFKKLTTTNPEHILSDTLFDVEQPIAVRKRLFFV